MHWTTAPIRVPDQAYLTAVEVGKLVGSSSKTVRRWVAEGRFPRPTFGKKWSAMSVGVWLAYQDFCPGNFGDDEANDGDSATPVKGR